MKPIQLLLAVFLLNVLLVSATEVAYNVTVNAHDVNNVTLTDSQNATQNCDAQCSYSMPSFTLPENVTIDSYALDYSGANQVYFESTNNKTTAKQDDNIIVKITPAPVICTQDECDKKCVKCDDGKCHGQGFKCIEEITLEKFFPVQIPIGVSQLNIVLNNTGTVDVKDLYVLVTGDGIETADKIPLQTLAAGTRDYVFATVNATKSGNIDIILKLYVQEQLNNKFTDQITVLEQPKIQENTTEVNVTDLTKQLDTLKETYKTVEQDYLTKKQQGYPVDIVYDKLKEAYSYITDTQSALLDGDYKKVQTNLDIINSSLSDIQDQLNSAKKQQQTLSDQIKGNFLFYGSIAAAIVSIFTAYELIKRSIDKKKLLALHKKLTKKTKFARHKK